MRHKEKLLERSRTFPLLALPLVGETPGMMSTTLSSINRDPFEAGSGRNWPLLAMKTRRRNENSSYIHPSDPFCYRLRISVNLLLRQRIRGASSKQACGVLQPEVAPEGEHLVFLLLVRSMDIYADLPSAKKSANSTTATSSSPSPAAPSSASKGWAHSKFQGMIAKRTATAVSKERNTPDSRPRYDY